MATRGREFHMNSGRREQKIDLAVNYFPVYLPACRVYHYEVHIRSHQGDAQESAFETTRKKFRRLKAIKNAAVIDSLLQYDEFAGFVGAYDGGKNLYSKFPVTAAPLTYPVELPREICNTWPSDNSLEELDIYDVSITPANKIKTCRNVISLNSLDDRFRLDRTIDIENITPIQTIIKTGPSYQRIPLGRYFFYPPGSPNDVHPLSYGREVWFGYHLSLRIADFTPVVNVNIAGTAFLKNERVIDYISEKLHCTARELLQVQEIKDADAIDLSKELEGLKVRTVNLGCVRKYRVLKLTKQPASRLKFPLDGSEEASPKTVQDYFQEKYKLRLQFPHLPCLQMYPEQRNVFLPLELCEIVQGQPVKGRMTGYQEKEIVNVTRLSPEKRFREIMKAIELEDFNNKPHSAEFGIQISSEPLRTEGRVIPPPSITYCSDRHIIPRHGVWEVKTLKFVESVSINSWVLLSFSDEQCCSRNRLAKFAEKLVNVALNYGITLGLPEDICIFDIEADDTLKNILVRFNTVRLAVIVLGRRNPTLYRRIKQTAEIELGLVTQCVHVSNVTRLKDSVIRSICHKINVKLGGINNVLTPSEKPNVFNESMIIIGAHIIHVPFSKFSIVAAVGSIDSHPSRYSVAFRIQSRQNAETIVDLENMVYELLKNFVKKNKGKKPAKIICYRSTLNESQYVRDCYSEIHSIRNACRNLSPHYEPRITIVAVQKSGQTCFKPQDDGQGVNDNVPPGTVIEKGVTSSNAFDFFLCSHVASQGTSRPSHYTVVYGGKWLTADELQKLTYYLCHAYAPCTRSISIPAPVAYAQLAARRAYSYLTQLNEYHTASETSPVDVHPNLKGTLFFV